MKKLLSVVVFLVITPSVWSQDKIQFEPKDMAELSQQQLDTKYNGKVITISGTIKRMERDRERNTDFYNMRIEYDGGVTFCRIYFADEGPTLREDVRQGRSVDIAVQGKFMAVFSDKKGGGLIVIKESKPAPAEGVTVKVRFVFNCGEKLILGVRLDNVTLRSDNGKKIKHAKIDGQTAIFENVPANSKWRLNASYNDGIDQQVSLDLAADNRPLQERTCTVGS